MAHTRARRVRDALDASICIDFTARARIDNAIITLVAALVPPLRRGTRSLKVINCVQTLQRSRIHDYWKRWHEYRAPCFTRCADEYPILRDKEINREKERERVFRFVRGTATIASRDIERCTVLLSNN